MSGARQVGMRLLIAMAAALALLAGCDHHDDDDDFIVSFPSAFEIAIHRVSDRPFDVIEIGVTPFSAQSLMTSLMPLLSAVFHGLMVTKSSLEF